VKSVPWTVMLVKVTELALIFEIPRVKFVLAVPTACWGNTSGEGLKNSAVIPVPVMRTICGDPAPECWILRIPAVGPDCFGLNIAFIVQEAATGKGLGQSLVWEKVELLELNLKPVMGCDPRFVKVTVCTPVDPSICEKKSSSKGETLKSEASTPVPIKLTVCAPPGPKFAAVSKPVRLRLAGGLNVTATRQLPCGGSGTVQVLVCANPWLTEIPVTVAG